MYAATWDEPWQETVIKESGSFVLARVTTFDPKKGAIINVLRTLAGAPLAGPVEVSGFYSLHLCNEAGEEAGFRFEGIDSCYVFLQKTAAGYAIATPTSGFAAIKHSKVAATYRHSYHQALVPQSVYEPTMTAIFQHYHGQPYDADYINKFVSSTLALAPARRNSAEQATFFLQHVALETTYHLGLTTYCTAILPFLRDTTNFHAQVSATRALAATATPEAKQQLIKVLTRKSDRDFVKVQAVWTLAAYHPTELKHELAKIAKGASAQSNGFGGNDMDPRSCTQIPTVKEALDALVAQL
ncbi:hypothetical protein [Hymenobacter baengnokdamensis]|uniref:hypothetical protein n=1 Tax=Hymenobacter baengnokdamensis TaxID=2615203 RepID=UPI001244F678|nr:hypothetical protein [Hymenobacter baengnokdamensis]